MTKKTVFLFMLVLLLLLLVLAGGAAAFYFFYYQPKHQKPSGEAPTQEEATPAETRVDFTGTFVRGEIPPDWTITEYRDGSGSDLLVGNVSYSGLTGLEVKNPGGTVVFKLQGVYGIGGMGNCRNYYRFADDSAAYFSEIQGISTEMGEPAPTIGDLTTAVYQEYELFEVRVRRVGTKIYWDKIAGDAYFQAACGISERIFNFVNPVFTGNGTAINRYQYTINETSPASELLELDAILESLATL